MAKRTPKPFIIAESTYYQIWREVDTREYRVMVAGQLVGYYDRLFDAERAAENEVYAKLQDGMIGDAALHMIAAA